MYDWLSISFVFFFIYKGSEVFVNPIFVSQEHHSSPTFAARTTSMNIPISNQESLAFFSDLSVGLFF